MTNQSIRGKAYTPAQKRLKSIAKQQSKLEGGSNIMTSEEVKQAQDLGFLVSGERENLDSTNNRGEEQRQSHGQVPRSENERPQRERKRGTFSGTSQKLSVTKSIPGYHLHIFNDDGTRIEDAISGGWEFCTPSEVGRTSSHVVSRNADLGEKVKFRVGKLESGEPMYAYLMKIKEEWWLEDQALAQSKNDLIDEAVRTGKDAKDNLPNAFYVGKENRLSRS